MRKPRVVLSLTLAMVFAFAVTGMAQQMMEPFPVGSLNFSGTSIAAGVGWSWGSGTFSFKGQDFKVKVQGLDVGAVGISTGQAHADVYNLKAPTDIEGTYTAVQAGITIAGGAKGQLARNEKGVVLDLTSVTTGLSLKLGAAGFTIKMVK